MVRTKEHDQVIVLVITRTGGRPVVVGKVISITAVGVASRARPRSTILAIAVNLQVHATICEGTFTLVALGVWTTVDVAQIVPHALVVEGVLELGDWAAIAWICAELQGDAVAAARILVGLPMPGSRCDGVNGGGISGYHCTAVDGVRATVEKSDSTGAGQSTGDKTERKQEGRDCGEAEHC